MTAPTQRRSRRELALKGSRRSRWDVLVLQQKKRTSIRRSEKWEIDRDDDARAAKDHGRVAVASAVGLDRTLRLQHVWVSLRRTYGKRTSSTIASNA